MKNVLIIFAKYPEPGKVKTRLAKNIGEVEAGKIYELFVPIILKRTKSESYATKVFFDPAEKSQEIKKWLGPDWDLSAQSKGSLGEKLKNAFSCIFSQGAEKSVVIGTDTPLLDAQLIQRAFIALDKADCVLGPSSDGGYYLLGMKKISPELFDLPDWSTNVVFEKTRQKALKMNYKLSILEEHFDVDEQEDLIMLEQKLEQPEYCNNIVLKELRTKMAIILKKS